jgi:predicted Zn-dependent protease
MRRSATTKLTLAALLMLPLGGCATHPVTGESELALISEEQEIQMGRDAHQQIVASMGLVEDEELQSYVSSLGTRLADVSERPNLPWTFSVVDDPTVNAFAVPGGFIYVTRGMMSHLTSEAQLVGILGHEIGQVTARHSVNQMSRAQLANLGLGLGMTLAGRATAARSGRGGRPPAALPQLLPRRRAAVGRARRGLHDPARLRAGRARRSLRDARSGQRGVGQ